MSCYFDAYYSAVQVALDLTEDDKNYLRNFIDEDNR